MNIVKHRYWSDAADRGLSDAVHDERDILAREVNAGRSELYQVDHDTWLVTFVEQPKLIICCLQGTKGNEVLEVLAGVAQARGLTDIRFFTKRASLIRATEKYGFTQEYVVMRAQVGDILAYRDKRIANANLLKTLQQIPDHESHAQQAIRAPTHANGNCKPS